MIHSFHSDKYTSKSCPNLSTSTRECNQVGRWKIREKRSETLVGEEKKTAKSTMCRLRRGEERREREQRRGVV